MGYKTTTTTNISGSQDNNQKAQQPNQTEEERNTLAQKLIGPKVGRFLKAVFKRYVPQYESFYIGRNLYSKTLALPIPSPLTPTTSTKEKSLEAGSSSTEVNKKNSSDGQKLTATIPDFWLAKANLPPTFQTWFSIQTMYLWLLTVRLRSIPNNKHYNQELVDNLFMDAEQKIRRAGIKSGKIINDTLKDLVSSFRGSLMAYDEGMIKGDAVLASALWRNLLVAPVEGEVEEVGCAKLMEELTMYLRKQLVLLEKVSDDDFIRGNFEFEKLE
ncbi:Ubiquinol cytochrome-c reductase assembly protein Cbp3 [Mycoemilia scoparia]|uniref:Ubiquinol cytochrome-c reductase assembly protein Cbp3 n=1 Tax=Mycoemilia scoparia TaxID=417184 RepID=A0A9W8DT57_9FUNG|nr:Ubiquinol cytochrome-c reductase assembly protein Cbp3 [Mycoemilia scoparia]